MSFKSPSVRRSRAHNGSQLFSFPQYQSVAETYGLSVVHKSYMSDSFARCSGLNHHDLLGHFGCVNAIEFSSNGGEFIVSGAHFVLLRFCSLFWSFDWRKLHVSRDSLLAWANCTLNYVSAFLFVSFFLV